MALTKVSTPAIKDEAITLAKLLHGDSNSNGKFLRANNGADPTFETVNTDLVSDTSPQLGGDLDSNGNNIKLGDSSSSNDDRLQIGAGTFGDLEIYHDGTNSYIDNKTGDFFIRGVDEKFLYIQAKSGENSIICKDDGAVELYFDNSKKLESVNGGIYVYGQLIFGVGTSDSLFGGDNNKIILGSGNDLQIYHDGTASFIKNTTGGLNLEDTGGYFRVKSDDIKLEAANGEDFLECDANGAVSLYYNGSEKLETVSNGVIIDNTCRIENINNKVSSMVNAVNNLEYKIHQTNGQSALQAAIISKGVSGWGGELEFYTKPADSNPNGNLAHKATLDENGRFQVHSQPYAMVSRGGANQSVGNNSGTVIAFNQEHFDVGNHFNNSNYRYTAPVDGVYQVNLTVQYTGNINLVHAGIYKNGGNPGVNGTFDPWCNWGDDTRAASFVHAIKLNAGDYIEGVTYQSTGNTQNLEQNRTKMTIYLLG